MKFNTKAQGLPLTTIAIAVLVILTLVIVILFATGSFGKLFGVAGKLVSSGGGDVGADQAACNSLCSSALQLPDKATFAKGSYCKKTMAYDLDGDGDLTDANEKDVRCWSDKIGVSCSGTLTSDEIVGSYTWPNAGGATPYGDCVNG